MAYILKQSNCNWGMSLYYRYEGDRRYPLFDVDEVLNKKFTWTPLKNEATEFDSFADANLFIRLSKISAEPLQIRKIR